MLYVNPFDFTICFVLVTWTLYSLTKGMLIPWREHRRFNRCVMYVFELERERMASSAFYASVWIGWRFGFIKKNELPSTYAMLKCVEEDMRKEGKDPSTVITELYRRAPILKLMESDLPKEPSL